METRIEKLRAGMRESGLDAALLTSPVAIRYYTGFTGGVDGTALITMRQTYLVTDFRYTIAAKAETNGCAEIVEAGYAEQLNVLKQKLVQDGCKLCGFEQDSVTVAAFESYRAFPVEWIPFAEQIALPRLYKSDDEIQNLVEAQRIADVSYAEWLTRVRVGMTEREAAAELLYVCAKNGSEGPSFAPIVAAGENGAMCHAVPGERKLQKGDLVVVDFGCLYHGYCSDMTRSFGIGSVDAEQKRIYDIVLQAQLLTLDALKGGVTGKALDAVARDYIASFGYGENFGHGLGHGFGLMIHEPPRAAMSSTDTLLPGMTITVEPGVYVEGKCGVRIEDCCVVTADGHINLVSSPKELILL